MIEQTKKKFIQISLLSFTLVIASILCVVNVMNFTSVLSVLDRKTEIINMNDGYIPTGVPPRYGEEKQRDDVFSGEEKYSTRFFTAEIDSDGNVVEINAEFVAAITKEEATSIAQQVSLATQETGWVQNYRYRSTALSSGKRFVFIDATRQLRSLYDMLGISVVVLGSSLLIIFILLLFIARKAIQPLIDNINRQKEFISNASHEIKTPLAILSANNDVLEMTGQKGKWTQSNRRQIDRLNQLVEQMLILSRFDEGKAELNIRSLHVEEVLRPIIEELTPLFDEANLTVATAVSAAQEVKCDEQSLQQLIRILLENAIKYCGPEKKIDIEITKNRLTVSNACEYMTEEERRQLFDRFYRREESRERSKGGSGMGLSIAKAIATANHLKLRAELLSPTRLAFHIEFPLK